MFEYFVRFCFNQDTTGKFDGLKPQSEVLLSEDSIIIIPKDISDLKKIFIIISQDLFPNYKNIITNSNILSSYVMK